MRFGIWQDTILKVADKKRAKKHLKMSKNPIFLCIFMNQCSLKRDRKRQKA